MAVEILLPQIGFSVTEGTLVEWFVEDGNSVQEGELLYAFESDKSTQEVESPATGVLRIFKAAGEELPVGTVLGEIL